LRQHLDNKARAEMIVDLLTIKDTGLIGTIGELIARLYLHSEHIGAFQFRSDSEFKYPFLNKKQTNYLKDLAEHGPNWCWDFIGIGHAGKDTYLIEVKTSRPRKRKHGLKSRWTEGARRGYSPEELEKAKLLGFKLLLVNVQLIENWKFEVTSREL